MLREPIVVRREMVIEASPARVFDAWADPGQIAHWYAEQGEGDARQDKQVKWVIGGRAQPLEVTAMEPDRRILLTNVGTDEWAGTVLDLTFEPEGAPGSTRLVLEQTTPAESLQDFMPAVDSGWACALAVLSEYLVHHAGDPRMQVEAHTPGRIDVAMAVEALASLDAIADWAGDRPARLLVSAPRGAVVAFAEFPGVFTIMGVGGANVFYATWGELSLVPVKAKVAALTDRLWARIGVVGNRPAT